MEKRSLYDQQVFEETLNRIDHLTHETKPRWGKMDAGQMLPHCAETIDVANGKPLEGTPFLVSLFRGYIKKMVVGPKPYSKNLRTHPQYLRTEPVDFAQEKQHLLDALHKLKAQEGEKIKHTMFGILTPEEKGWGMYKHLDHHLQQFGV